MTTMIWDETQAEKAAKLIVDYEANVERAQLVFDEFQTVADEKLRELYGCQARLRDFREAVAKAELTGEW